MLIETFNAGFFYLIAALSLLFAFFVVSAKNILHSALSLMVVLTFSAALYLLLGAEFMAGIQLLVYIGGIVVLMVFAIMLTGASDRHEEKKSITGKKSLAATASILFFTFVAGALVKTDFPVVNTEQAPLSGAKEIGLSLLSFESNGYVLPFEIISVLLLAALIGGIVIARKETEGDE